MKPRIIVLIDFSPNTLTQVKLAEKWSEWLNAELLLVHHLDVAYPAMSDQQTRDEIYLAEKEVALDKVREFAINNIKKGVPVQYHVSEENLLLTVKEMLREYEDSLVIVGLKSTGFFKRIFPGSTVTKLVDEVGATVIAVPQQIDTTSPATLYVSVYYKYPLNEQELDKLLFMFGDKINRLVFLSVFSSDEDKNLCADYLAALAQKYRLQKQVAVETYEGKDAFQELKNYMSSHTDGPLVLQRGARTLTDHLSRKFLINELVYDACIPLIILPS